jgi:hypothetical protein
MAAAGLTAYKLYRQLWPQKSINETLFALHPELGLLKKDTSFYEKVRWIGVGTAAPEGIGPRFDLAKASKTASGAVEFQCATQPYYALFSIEGDLMRRSKNDKALLVDPIKRESSNAILAWKQDMCVYIHGNGGGALAQSSAVSAATITVPAKKARFFRKGMRLSSASTDGTSGTVNPGYVTVSAVNRRTGVITVSEASVAAGIPAVAATDYWFRYGVFGNVLPGFEAWNPVSDPSATAFRGVDRTVDTEMLGGLRISATTKTPRAAAKMAANAVYDNGGNPNLYLLSTDDWANLEADLDSAGSLVRTQVAASPLNGINFGVSYEAIKMNGPAGPIMVVASPNAPTGVGRMLTKETWTLGCMGELLHDIDENNTEDGADAKEFRMLGDVDLYTDCPGLQFYSGNYLDGTLRGQDRVFERYAGLCLEPQQFPDAPNQPGFPQLVCRPGQPCSMASLYALSNWR